MVDAHDSKSCIARCESSSLSSGTANRKMTSYDVIFLLAVPEKYVTCGGRESFSSEASAFVTESLLRQK